MSYEGSGDNANAGGHLQRGLAQQGKISGSAKKGGQNERERVSDGRKSRSCLTPRRCRKSTA